MRLSELKTGQSGYIIKVLGHGGFRRRILEMGFIRGQKVEVLLNAPLKDPIKYKVMGYEVSLRRSEAALIEVVSQEEVVPGTHGASAVVEGRDLKKIITERKKQINIALVGNPNSGKSSLYNALAGGYEHVGNYSGVTVDAKRGTFTYRGYKFVIYDLPGTYALSPYTPEELYVRRHLTENTPDVIVNVVAASNLERNLYLTTELIDIDQETVIALNMYDELEKSGAKLDHDTLGTLLGIPVVPVVAKQSRGLKELLAAVIDVYEHRSEQARPIRINHGASIEQAFEALRGAMEPDFDMFPEQFSRRYMILKFLEGDREVEKTLRDCPHYAEWLTLREREAKRIEKELGQDIESAVTDQKYGFIAGALRETYLPSQKDQLKHTHAIDAMVTHKLWGFPIFFFLMWVMFEATFRLGAYPMEWIEKGVEALGGWIGGMMAAGPFRDLLTEGIIGGVGSVIVFLPNILILFLFISFMEDSGYMARAAFIMDKIMHRIGLHGKSFIPLIMGFGCNVPGIMAARTIESRSSRIITILISPFISCSARLPIYILLAGTFFPSYAGLVLFSMYLLGIALAALTSIVMRRTMFRRDDTPFVMELPPYRMPTFPTSLRHMWDNGKQYLKKMGGVILAASIVVWVLSYYPRGTADMTPSQQKEQSYLGRAGKFVDPVMKPLGIPWKGSVALVAGVGAKEITVSTLGVLYSGGDGDEGTAPLSQQLKKPDPLTGESDWTPLTALSFMIFALLYFPCLAVLAAIRKEAGGTKWALLSVTYNTLLAWAAAFVVYNAGLLIIGQ